MEVYIHNKMIVLQFVVHRFIRSGGFTVGIVRYKFPVDVTNPNTSPTRETERETVEVANHPWR
jgi:hypothetical protein